MKLNPDCIRDILFAIEEKTSMKTLFILMKIIVIQYFLTMI